MNTEERNTNSVNAKNSHRPNEKQLRPRVYVCHPFANDPERNIDSVRGICGRLAAEGVMPIGVHFYLPQFIDEATDRELALELCLELLATCDEVRVYGDVIT